MQIQIEKDGTLFLDGKKVTRNTVKAFQLYKALAEQGDAIAQAFLGKAWLEGRGTEANETEAFRWYGQSALQGYGPAQYVVGTFYESGGKDMADRGSRTATRSSRFQ